MPSYLIGYDPQLPNRFNLQGQYKANKLPFKCNRN
jgi:hypothetical protein